MSFFLTKHFTLEELTHSEVALRNGFDNTPSEKIISNLRTLAELLETIRNLWNLPLIIKSGYRSPYVNHIVGGRPNSQHLEGKAADFIIAGKTPKETIDTILDHSEHVSPISFDQLILEFNSWVHISFDKELPRLETLIIDEKGTRRYTT